MKAAMNHAWLFLVVAACVLCVAAAMPARRSASPDLAARRRSATDRTFIRFGRSSFPDMTAAELREELKTSQQLMRFPRARQDNIIRLGRSDNFLRFGRSQPLRLTDDELLDLVRSYDPEEYGNEIRAAKRRTNNFVRLGRRDNNFLRLGRSAEEYTEPGFEVNGELMLTHKQPERKANKDSYLRLGRSGEGSDGLNEVFDEEESTGESREKRSAKEN